MNEKRFTYFKVPVGFAKQGIKDNVNDEVFDFTLNNVLDKLNEQSDTIEGLILDRNRQEEKLDIARRNLSKQLEKIEELKKENEKLRKVCSHLKKENQSLIENIFDIYEKVKWVVR